MASVPILEATGTDIEELVFQPVKAIIMFGAPGTDRSTQCQKICEKYGFVRITPAGIINTIRRTPGMRYHEIVVESLQSDSRIPGYVFCDFIKDVVRAESRNTIFLIESFPNNKEYLYTWMQSLSLYFEIIMVINLNCPKNTCIDRIMQYKPIINSRDVSRRKDAIFAVQSYIKDLRPVIDFYRSIGLVLEIDTLLAADLVFERIQFGIKTSMFPNEINNLVD